MEPEQSREVTAWLSKSDTDLRAAEAALSVSPPIIEDAMFHCQQAVEKAIKAFLVAHGISFRKTHDLDQLTSLCDQIDPQLRQLLDPVLHFTVFAWIFRYPAETETPSIEEANDALSLSRSACISIRSRMPVLPL